MLEFLASAWVTWISAILAVLVLGGIIGAIGSDSKEGLIGAGVLVVVEIFLVWAFIFSGTHRVVPVNSIAILENTMAGKIENTLQSGLVETPFIGYELHMFPAVQNLQICNEFTPSVKGGYGVKTNICFYINSSAVDWKAQVKSYNSWDTNALVGAWYNQVAGIVGDTIKEYSPADLTGNKLAISELLYGKVNPKFNQLGVQLNSVQFMNWDFQSAEMSAEYDKTITAQTQSIQAEAELARAEVERKTRMYKQDTEILAMTQWVEAQKKQMELLELESEEAKLDWLKLQWLRENPNSTVIVTMGNSSNVLVNPNNIQPVTK